MKIRHYLFPALVAMMFVSCQKDDTQTPVDNGAKKSVTVTITNVAAPATRTSQDEFTPSGIPIATVGSLNVLFADENGEVVDTRLLSSGELLDDDPNPSSGPSDIIDQDGTGTGNGTKLPEGGG